MDNQEKAEEYSEKVMAFCKEYYLGGLKDFQEYREMVILHQKIDWTTLDGLEEYLDLYLKNMEKKNLQKNTPRDFLKFVSDLSDIISYLEHTSARDNLLKFEKYICKFIGIFESIPLWRSAVFDRADFDRQNKTDSRQNSGSLCGHWCHSGRSGRVQAHYGLCRCRCNGSSDRIRKQPGQRCERSGGPGWISRYLHRGTEGLCRRHCSGDFCGINSKHFVQS